MRCRVGRPGTVMSVTDSRCVPRDNSTVCGLHPLVAAARGRLAGAACPGQRGVRASSHKRKGAVVTRAGRSDLHGRTGWAPAHWRAALHVALAVWLSLAIAGCARVTVHKLVLPERFSLGDASFLPTMEAVTGSPVTEGNRVDLLLNGDNIFPAHLRAIRAATKTITYAQYYYEDGPISRDLAMAFSERCQQGVIAHVLL